MQQFNCRDPFQYNLSHQLWPHNNHINGLGRSDDSHVLKDELMDWNDTVKQPTSNFFHNNNNKNRIKNEMDCNDNSTDPYKKQPEINEKDLEFVEETIDLFKLPIDFLQWNEKNIGDWFYWIRHKLRFKCPKVSKEIIDFHKEDPTNKETWLEKFGSEAGLCMYKEFSNWIKYKILKTKSDTGRKHNGEYNKTIDKPRRRNEKKDGLYLWQILLTMLSSEKCSYFITWTDYGQGMFKIKEPTAVSVIWGESKGNPHMTYDKMSRSMRQYYKSNLLKKTNHDKLNYCFNMDDISVKKFIKRCHEKMPEIKIPQRLLQRSNS